MSETHLEDYADRIRPKTASNLLLWGILAFLVIFILWARFASIDRTVRGPGRVIASSHLQVVSNLEGGIVEAILVKTGQSVKEGDELLRLDQTETGAALGSGEAAYNAQHVKAARLQAEVAGRNPVYPAARDQATRDQIEIERSLHTSRMAELSSLLGAAQAQVVQAQRAVSEAESNYEARVSARNAAQRELGMIRPLVERGIEPRLSLIQSENAASVAASEAASASSAIARTQSAVAEARARVAQQRQDWRSQAADELARVQADMASRRSSLPALANRLARTAVRAPLPGRINRVLVTTVGAAVAPGAPLVEIVPSEESLLIEARVDPKDIAFVRIGQRARVDITAYDPAVYGGLEGKVTAISPDAVVEERTGTSYYVVQIRTAKNALHDRAGRPLPIGPGMVATAALIGDKRTVLQYLLTPITRLGETAFRE